MRISELSRVSGVSVPTIKFYLREGLLHAGASVSRTQADYDTSHLERLKLLRALREVADVPISRLRDLMSLLDRDVSSIHGVLAVAVDAINPPPRDMQAPDERPARQFADAMVSQAGWTGVRPEAPDRARLADLLEVMMGFQTHEDRLDILQVYLEAADRIGRSDVANLDDTQSVQALVSEVVIGQVVAGEILLTLRRLAEEHYSSRRFT